MTPGAEVEKMLKYTERRANLLPTTPMRARMKAMNTVAKTSKKPSTHRCTTHQRQYSASEMWLPLPYIRPAM